MYVIMHYPKEEVNGIGVDCTDAPMPLSVHFTRDHAEHQLTWYWANGYHEYDHLQIIEVDCPDK
jgi:hypothetical protein